MLLKVHVIAKLVNLVDLVDLFMLLKLHMFVGMFNLASIGCADV